MGFNLGFKGLTSSVYTSVTLNFQPFQIPIFHKPTDPFRQIAANLDPQMCFYTWTFFLGMESLHIIKNKQKEADLKKSVTFSKSS